MRPTTAKRVVRVAINHYMDTGNPCKLYAKVCVKALEKLTEKQITWHKKEGYEYWVGDPVNVTRMMYEDSCHGEGELSYISDRFDTPSRLHFLTVGIRERHFKECRVYRGFSSCIDPQSLCGITIGGSL